MEKIDVRRLTFGAYMKLFCISGVSAGAIAGILLLISGLLGGQATATIGNTTFTGPLAGIIGFFLGPLLLGVAMAWFALLMYWPFRLFVKIFRGVTFTAFAGDDAVPARQADASVRESDEA